MTPTLRIGQTYSHHSNGDKYVFRELRPMYGFLLERVSDGWTFIAHGVCRYPDGTIDWGYSTDGHWPDGEPRRTSHDG